MSRYGNVTILPAEPNPWADALGLVGSVMGKNAYNRQDAKDVDAMVEGITPTNPGLLTNSNSTVQATANPNISPQSATTGGLLSGNTLKGNINASLAPNTSFLDTQIQPTTQATPMQAQTVTQPQQQTNTAKQTQTWADVENQYNQAWAQKAKSIFAKMSPEGRKQYMQQIMATREQGLNDLKTQFTKQETANNWDAFNQEADPKKKLFYAVKNGMDVKSAQMLLDPDTETQLVDMGGQKVLIGRNKYTNQYTNMMTGEPLNTNDLTKTMTPEGADASARGWASVANQRAAIDARGSSGYGGSSGGGDKQLLTNAKYAVDKHTQWVKDHTNKLTGDPPDETQSPYYGYAKQGQKILDSYYGIGGNDDNGGGGADYNKGISQVTAALGKGISKDKIIAAVRQDYGDMADTILTDSGLIGGTQSNSSSGIDLSAPTFGDNDQTLLDYLDSGNAWTDFYNGNRNMGK